MGRQFSGDFPGSLARGNPSARVALAALGLMLPIALGCIGMGGYAVLKHPPFLLGAGQVEHLFGSAPYDEYEAARRFPLSRVAIEFLDGPGPNRLLAIQGERPWEQHSAILLELTPDGALVRAALVRSPAEWFRRLGDRPALERSPLGWDERNRYYVEALATDFSDVNAYRLVGTATLSDTAYFRTPEDPDVTRLELDLHSTEPVPPFTDFFAFRRAELARWQHLSPDAVAHELHVLERADAEGQADTFRIRALFVAPWRIKVDML